MVWDCPGAIIAVLGSNFHMCGGYFYSIDDSSTRSVCRTAARTGLAVFYIRGRKGIRFALSAFPSFRVFSPSARSFCRNFLRGGNTITRAPGRVSHVIL